MLEPPRYLRLLARVRPDNTVRRVRTQVTEHTDPSLTRARPAAFAEVVASDGRLLLRWPVAGDHLCVSSTGPSRPSDLLLRAHIPLPQDAGRLRLLRDGVLMTELDLASELPAIELQWPPDGLDVAAGRQTVGWRASATTGEAFLRYSCDDGRTWLRIGGRSSGAAFAVDFDELPGGPACRLALAYTAGARTVTVESRPFRVAAKPPDLAVASPADGAVLDPRVPVLLEAAMARELGARAADAGVVWQSDRDGELGRGLTVWTALSPGRHHLSVTMLAEPASAAEVRVEVGQ